MHNSKTEILNFLKILKPELNAEGIISLGLFGSVAKDTNTLDSDIDIVYETSDMFISNHQGWSAFTYLNTHLRDKIAKKFNTNVDMFDLNSSSSIKEKVRKEALYV
ncbi:MAG: nucleotidyltransferase domain-containing protein [Campylobacterales bacterium]|nr:nucleotidyltransferase domain-containing protein [Campylobacterales bacterium]